MKYANFVVFRSNAILNIDSVDLLCHSSEIGGLFSMKSFSKTVQTLLYFLWKKNPHSLFPVYVDIAFIGK